VFSSRIFHNATQRGVLCLDISDYDEPELAMKRSAQRASLFYEMQLRANFVLSDMAQWIPLHYNGYGNVVALVVVVVVGRTGCPLCA